MKRHAASQIIGYIFIMPLIQCLLLAIMSLPFWAQGQFGLLLFSILSIYLFEIVIEVILFHNAFHRIYIDDKGIANKFFQLYWDDMPAFRIIELNFGFLPTIFSVDILCMGDTSASNFIVLDPRKTIFLSLNKKTKEKLRALAGDNCPV